MELLRQALSKSQQQLKGSAWNRHAKSGDAGLRFGKSLGSRMAGCHFQPQGRQELNRAKVGDPSPTLAGAGPSEIKGRPQGTPSA